MFNTHYLELSLSRTYFHGSNGVRTSEVLLYLVNLLYDGAIAISTTYTAGYVLFSDMFSVTMSSKLLQVIIKIALLFAEILINLISEIMQ